MVCPYGKSGRCSLRSARSDVRKNRSVVRGGRLSSGRGYGLNAAGTNAAQSQLSHVFCSWPALSSGAACRQHSIQRSAPFESLSSCCCACDYNAAAITTRTRKSRGAVADVPHDIAHTGLSPYDTSANPAWRSGTSHRCDGYPLRRLALTNYLL